MKEVKVPPTAQLVALLAVLGAILALIAAEAPEIRRYLSIRSM
jgi:uncharacterized protein DUF6893